MDKDRLLPRDKLLHHLSYSTLSCPEYSSRAPIDPDKLKQSLGRLSRLLGRKNVGKSTLWNYCQSTSGLGSSLRSYCGGLTADRVPFHQVATLTMPCSHWSPLSLCHAHIGRHSHYAMLTLVVTLTMLTLVATLTMLTLVITLTAHTGRHSHHVCLHCPVCLDDCL